VGPYVVPAVNLEEHLDERNVNMVTSVGQATIPVVAAVAAVAPVRYAEIVASIASRSAGRATRANIDECHRHDRPGARTGRRRERGKAIIVLNPAEPALIMRRTPSMCLVDDVDRNAVRHAGRDDGWPTSRPT